jgi:hypothetical protein
MWYHGWQFSQQRFSMSEDNPTEALALMAKKVWGNWQNSK